MGRLGLIVLLFASACTPRTAPPKRAPASSTPAPTTLELAARPSAARAYVITMRDRAAIERRGPGAGRARVDVEVRAKVSRQDEAIPAGLRVKLAFDDVDARSYGPMGGAAAKALATLRGSKASLDVDAKGVIAAFAFEGSAEARPVVERLSRLFVKMSPSFAGGARSLGGRWGETASIPLESRAGEEPARASLQASYVYQRQGVVNGRPCAVVSVELRPAANVAIPGAAEGAITSSGTGQGELCLEPETGALRFGSFDLTLKTEVGVRRSPSPRVRALHLEETRRVRLDVEEA